jgi:hypothetical protein
MGGGIPSHPLSPHTGRERLVRVTERKLAAGDVARILRIYLKIVEELPADIEAGWLDDGGQVHFAPDIGAKLKAARQAAGILHRLGRGNDPA